MINKVQDKITEILDILAEKFGIIPLVNTEYRQEFNKGQYGELGKIKYWYTIDNITISDDTLFLNNEYFYKITFKIRLEYESDTPDIKYDELLLFLKNKRETKIFIDKLNIKDYKIIIRKASNYSKNTIYYNGNARYKNIIGFEFQAEMKGEKNKWQ